MLKPRKSLFTSEQKAVMRKPQYRIYDQVRDRAIAIISQWFLDEFELHGNQGAILAEEIVPKVIAAKQDKIQPTAPDVYLSEKEVLNWVILDSKKMAGDMDSRNELEATLAEWEDRNEAEKHGL